MNRLFVPPAHRVIRWVVCAVVPRVAPVSALALLVALGTSMVAHAQTAPAAAPAAPAASAPPPPPPPPAPPPEVVKVGDQNKLGVGKVTDVERGDNGCYITLMDAKSREFIEIGLMEICSQKPSIKGKKIALEYKVTEIQATSCYGDPKCTKRETVPLVISAKELN